MKKYLWIVLGCLLLAGCGNNDDVIKKMEKKMETNSYHLSGELSIINNEDTYLYDVEVSYAKENNFRVSLKNKTNDHEQIILRNEDGVYVLTPSLNKSFKFQSEWPYNNSQAYLLQTIMNDLKNDDEKEIIEENGNYIITTKANYSNNPDLTHQKIYVDSEYNITKVEILNNEDNIKMEMNFNDIDYKATFDDTYFTLKSNIGSESIDETSKTLDSITYPMFIPENTYLESQDKVTMEENERVILTFGGDYPFMIVEEPVSISSELLTIPMYGEPHIITGTVGALSDSSITWVNNGIEYYVVSDTLTKDQLLNVANSISVLPVGK